MLVHHVCVWCLGVLHQCASAIAVYIDRDESAIIPGQMQLARHPVGRLLALQNVVIAGAIARLMNLVERGCAQKFVVVRKDPFIVTKIADWRVELLVIRAPRVAGHDIINDSIAIHKCAVKHLIAQIRQIAPTVDVRLGQPKMIGAKTARGNRIAEHHDAFTHR